MPTIDGQIGRTLMRLRKEADLSQHDLAEQMGVGQATVSRWEAGAPMTAAQVCAAANAMRLPPWLVLALAESHEGCVLGPGVVATIRALLAHPVGDTIG